jgi:tRNA U34 5-carboxymethylaminomethyl modifying GTPase MnmE/TrmE
VIIACRDFCDQFQPEWAMVSGQARAVPRIDVVLRCDLATDARAAEGMIRTSSRTGAGLAELRRALFARIAEVTRDRSPATLRMRVGVNDAQRAIAAAQAAITAVGNESGMADEAVVAGLLHQGIDALGDVTGTSIGTDLLDRIFSRHCVGK